MDFRGFDSSIILILNGGIPRTIGIFPDSSSQAVVAGRFFVGRLGAEPPSRAPKRPADQAFEIHDTTEDETYTDKEAFDSRTKASMPVD